MGNDEVRRRPLTEVIALNRLQWLGPVMDMAIHCLAFRAASHLLGKAGGSDIAVKP